MLRILHLESREPPLYQGDLPEAQRKSKVSVMVMGTTMDALVKSALKGQYLFSYFQV